MDKSRTHRSSRFSTFVIAGALFIGGFGVIFLSGLVRNAQSTVSAGGTESLPLLKEKEPYMHRGLATSTDPQLRLLSTYEQRLRRGLASNMVFVGMTPTLLEAEERAAYLAPLLQEYAKQGVEPLVVLEPDALDLRNLDPAVVTHFFWALKKQGVTDKHIGSWMILPEPNIPEWSAAEDKGNTDPKLFVKNYSMVAGVLKEYFPKAKGVVLLDSATYGSYDIGYTKPSYNKKDLLAYTDGLKPELVDAVGLQGFAWGEQHGDLKYDARTFLDADLAIALAKALDVEQVWLNSGTFSSMYDWDPTLRVQADNELRAKILRGIADQAKQVQKAGFRVSIHIFAQDKRETEANWSYTSDEEWSIFQNFVNRIEHEGIGLAIFDVAK